MPAYIRLDLFPATVVVGDTMYHPARVIVTDESAYVYMDSPTGPELVYRGRLDDYSQEGSGRSVTYTVVLDDEEQTMSIKKASGCGCGSRLRGLRPFPGIPLVGKTS